MTDFFLKNEAETIAFGQKISTKLRQGDIVKFTGPLGAGKTTMVRGIVAGLGGNPASVHSPTFSLVHEYDVSSGTVKHCDFYRLHQNTDLEDLGGLEFFSEDSFYLLEWPERLGIALPEEKIITIDLSVCGDGRTARITSVRKIFD